MTDRYDVIVLGVGGMGAATVATLAERGVNVLGLERYDVPHRYGSSHGVTRIIRKAYFENPDYIPLVERAYELWDALEADVDRQLQYTTGSLEIGPPTGTLIQGSQQSCEKYNIPYERLSNEEIRDRYPAHEMPTEYVGIFQPDGGFLHCEQCTIAHVERAHQHGAQIHARERVTSWRTTPAGGVQVETDQDRYRADRLVLTAGSWTGRFVDELEEFLSPERQVVAWFQPEEPTHFESSVFPVFITEVPDGIYYGFPSFERPGFKFGKYHHREEVIDPETKREPTQVDERLLREYAETYLPTGAGPTLTLQTCLFTNTPDRDFILDTLPDRPQVVVGAGFSGHGFKFASVIGEILADLALEGDTEYDLEAFSIDRF